MNLIFHDFIGDFMHVYIDDIMIKSKSKSSHLHIMRKYFERMRKDGLKMNPLKCAFGISAGEFLGFIVPKSGIEIDRNKVKVILDTKALMNKKQL